MYWLSDYITILSGGIKWHQNSDVINRFSRLCRFGRHSFRSFLRWIWILSGLSGYDLAHHHSQAVDKKNTEDHSPYANVNYSNLCILCHDCLDLPRRLKTSKVKRKLSRGQKRPGNIVTAATVYWSLLRLYLLWMIGFLTHQVVMSGPASRG